jgi:hypothetical protein
MYSIIISHRWFHLSIDMKEFEVFQNVEAFIIQLHRRLRQLSLKKYLFLKRGISKFVMV